MFLFTFYLATTQPPASIPFDHIFPCCPSLVLCVNLCGTLEIVRWRAQ